MESFEFLNYTRLDVITNVPSPLYCTLTDLDSRFLNVILLISVLMCVFLMYNLINIISGVRTNLAFCKNDIRMFTVLENNKASVILLFFFKFEVCTIFVVFTVIIIMDKANNVTYRHIHLFPFGNYLLNSINQLSTYVKQICFLHLLLSKLFYYLYLFQHINMSPNHVNLL